MAVTVSTEAVSAITTTTCTGNGTITENEVGNPVTRRGFCYVVGTSGDPTTANNVVYDDGSFGSGAYTKAITELSPTTGYRIRSYVIWSQGTVYGDTVQITTLRTPFSQAVIIG